jgi:ABC-type multidrug transport system fused ATPase/permease subunit
MLALDPPSVTFSRIFTFAKADSVLLLPAFLGSAVKGCSQPLIGYLVAQMMGNFYMSDKSELMKKVTVSSINFLAVAVAVFIAIVLQIGLFSRVGQGFVYRARCALFRRLVFKDIAFHDKRKNTPGILSDVLATKTQRMAVISGESFGIFLEMICSIVCGMTIGFIASPALAGVVLAILPIMISAQYVRSAVFMGVSKLTGQAKQEAVQVVSEALQNVRTLKASRAEGFVTDLYIKYLNKGDAKQGKGALIGAFTYGISVGIGAAAYAIAFYYGGYLVVNKGLNVVDFTQSLMGILMAAGGAGQALVFLPDANQAKVAAIDFFALFDAENQIHPNDTDVVIPAHVLSNTLDIENENIDSIEFQSVHFRYPSRPGVAVLQGLSFTVDCSQSAKAVAFTGNSGGGKSSVMSLLQRFYDADSGEIFINNQNIKSFDVFQLRRLFAVVSQEPVLFDLTLRQNLVYGVAKDTVSDETVQQAMDTAAIDFVPSTLKLDDRVGPRGSLLSGGQKQRVAIARALLKRSPIMLFDEATSALDSMSERLVQDAIDQSTKDKISIVIAHRLSTVRNSDVILVINEGTLLESGNHDTLMANNNLYAQLYNQGRH